MGKEFFSYLKCRSVAGNIRRKPFTFVNSISARLGDLQLRRHQECHFPQGDRIRVGQHVRYRELLPIDGEATVGLNTGFTPLVKADRLAKALGLRELYVKNDAFNYPTLSFKDRVVSVALTRAKELGFKIVALRLDR